VLAPVSESTADLLFGGQSVDWEQQEPEAMAAARAASGAWSRLIRTPRKRSGHVVLDLCSAAPACGSSQRAASPGRGVLLRQVVSRAAARREAGGTAAYRLARSLRWGDLWPQHYQGSFRSDPALGG
jgi:ribosomal protein RSM22 (predicted rRNA methylase)